MSKCENVCLGTIFLVHLSINLYIHGECDSSE